MKKLTAEEWVAYGLKQGWCGPPLCSTHDGIPLSFEEEELFEEFDPCVTIIRLYDDEDMRKEVEENHSPSVWRKGSFKLD